MNIDQLLDLYFARLKRLILENIDSSPSELFLLKTEGREVDIDLRSEVLHILMILIDHSIDKNRLYEKHDKLSKKYLNEAIKKIFK